MSIRWTKFASVYHGTALVLLVSVGWMPALLHGADIEREPINYSSAPESNSISRLQARIDAGKAVLAFDEDFGYLPALLRELQVPTSSQMLVFSKTSLQRHRIESRKPRALYFNDHTYVGYCQRGAVLEVTAIDPKLGAVFYTLDQTKVEKPKLQRQNDTCLICHGSSQNQGFPGNLVRSVYADAEGLPILSSGTFRIDHTSPLKDRWGGWFVTGTSGKQLHLGNLVVRDKRQRPEDINNTAGTNVTDLSRWIKPSAYLSGHSDIVALMVFEHQAEMQNRIIRAGFLTRQALYDEAELNKLRDGPSKGSSELTRRRIHSPSEQLVKYLLFSGETKLSDKISGTSGFAAEFAKQGPKDSRGRSLRDLDLQSGRLFRYPCSYLIYSEAFDALPEPAKEYVLRRLHEILTAQDKTPEFAHLSAADRQAILEILAATKKNFSAPPGSGIRLDR